MTMLQTRKNQSTQKPAIGYSNNAAKEQLKNQVMAHIDHKALSNYAAREFVLGSMRATLSDAERPVIEELRRLNEERRPLKQANANEAQSQAIEMKVVTSVAPKNQVNFEQARRGFEMISTLKVDTQPAGLQQCAWCEPTRKNAREFEKPDFSGRAA